MKHMTPKSASVSDVCVSALLRRALVKRSERRSRTQRWAAN